jgi:hypothetical protein
MKILITAFFLLGTLSTFACTESPCKGDKVQFRLQAAKETYPAIGKVLTVFSNGQVEIDVDGRDYHVILDRNDIGIAFRCSGRLCKGDRVQFRLQAAKETYPATGKVLAIFSNGQVHIDVDGRDSHVFLNVSTLGYELNCYN